MSGIAGIISPEARNQKKIIEDMLDIIKHRGSHFKKILINKNVIIGFQSDLNTVAHSDNIYLFLDGLIYNGDELINLIFGKNSMQLTDEEILLHLYKKFGLKGFERVNGDFVVVIWDSSQETLLFAKYLTNNKNIFYHHKGKNFIFASEIKSLFKHPLIGRELDLNAINDFLTFRHIPAPYTAFQNIKRLEAASVIIYRQNQIDKERLNFFNFDQKFKNFENIDISELSDSFEKSILRRVEKIKDFGLFLSGGIDSSTILYFLNKFSTNPVKTYTVGLKRDKIYAAHVAKYFKCKHREFELTPDLLIRGTSKAIWYLEYPMAHAGSFQYFLPKISREEKYIFWGQGAEELFYGRQDYLYLLLGTQMIKRVIPSFICKKLKKIGSKISYRTKFHKLITLIGAEDPFEIYGSFRRVFTLKEKKKFFYKEFIKENGKQRLSSLWGVTADPLLNYSYLTMCNGFLSDTFFNIKQEILNPYMDKEFISLLFSVPSYLKIRKLRLRYLQKEMMKDKLPKFILKRGRDTWHLQTQGWVKAKKNIFFYFIEGLKKRKIVKADIEEFSKNYFYKIDEKLWALLNLEVFFRIFIDNKNLTEPSYLYFPENMR